MRITLPRPSRRAAAAVTAAWRLAGVMLGALTRCSTHPAKYYLICTALWGCAKPRRCVGLLSRQRDKPALRDQLRARSTITDKCFASESRCAAGRV